MDPAGAISVVLVAVQTVVYVVERIKQAIEEAEVIDRDMNVVKAGVFTVQGQLGNLSVLCVVGVARRLVNCNQAAYRPDGRATQAARSP